MPLDLSHTSWSLDDRPWNRGSDLCPSAPCPWEGSTKQEAPSMPVLSNSRIAPHFPSPSAYSKNQQPPLGCKIRWSHTFPPPKPWSSLLSRDVVKVSMTFSTGIFPVGKESMLILMEHRVSNGSCWFCFLLLLEDPCSAWWEPWHVAPAGRNSMAREG